MSKTPDFEIMARVTVTPAFNSTDGVRYPERVDRNGIWVQWTDGKDRYHVNWSGGDIGKRTRGSRPRPTIYVNSLAEKYEPKGSYILNPEYHETKYLDADAKAHKPIADAIRALMTPANIEQAYQLAESRERHAQAAEKTERADKMRAALTKVAEDYKEAIPTFPLLIAEINALHEDSLLTLASALRSI